MIPANSASNQRLHMLYPRMSKGAKLNMEKAPTNVRKALRLNARRYAILQTTLDKIERDQKRATAIMDEKFKAFLRKPLVGPIVSREYNVSIKVSSWPSKRPAGEGPVLRKMKRKGVRTTQSRTRLSRDRFKLRARFADGSIEPRFCDSQRIGIFSDFPKVSLSSTIQPTRLVEISSSLKGSDHLRDGDSVNGRDTLSKPAQSAALLPPVNRSVCTCKPSQSKQPVVPSTTPENKAPKQVPVHLGHKNRRHFLPFISQKSSGFLVKGEAVIYNVR